MKSRLHGEQDARFLALLDKVTRCDPSSTQRGAAPTISDYLDVRDDAVHLAQPGNGGRLGAPATSRGGGFGSLPTAVSRRDLCLRRPPVAPGPMPAPAQRDARGGWLSGAHRGIKLRAPVYMQCMAERVPQYKAALPPARRGAPARVSEILDAHGGHFFVLQRFSQGTFGKLRLAACVRRQNLWAVKEFRLTPGGAVGGTEVSAWHAVERELQTMQALNPSLSVDRVVLARGRAFAFMPRYLNNLANVLPNLLPDERPVVLLAMQRDVFRVLQTMHARGIMHRDLKPDNILLDHKSFTPCDFGLAEGLAPCAGHDGPLDSQPIAGTQSFIAPENFYFQGCERSDQWGVGVTVLAAYTRNNPFVGFSPDRLLVARRQCDEYEEWLADLVDASGQLDVRRIATGTSHFDAAFRSVLSADPDLCARMRGGILHRDPAVRPSAEEALACVEAQIAARPAVLRLRPGAAAGTIEVRLASFDVTLRRVLCRLHSMMPGAPGTSHNEIRCNHELDLKEVLRLDRIYARRLPSAANDQGSAAVASRKEGTGSDATVQQPTGEG